MKSPCPLQPVPVECIDIAELLNFNQGNAFKYVWRAHEKGKATEDMLKAVFYLEREIAHEARLLQWMMTFILM